MRPRATSHWRSRPAAVRTASSRRSARHGVAGYGRLPSSATTAAASQPQSSPTTSSSRARTTFPASRRRRQPPTTSSASSSSSRVESNTAAERSSSLHPGSVRMPSVSVRAQTIAVVLVVVLSGCGSSGRKQSSSTTARPGSASALAPVHGPYSPKIDVKNFVAKVDNPLWPLQPGTAYHFKGVRGTTPQTDDEVVLHRTKRTLDYYAQDKDGNVWYLGEDSFELQHGRFARASDSWLSGVDGAKPGIIMPADPRAGDSYRQEYYPPGEALDEARVLGLRAAPRVPYRAFKNALVPSAFSPPEPQTEA